MVRFLPRALHRIRQLRAFVAGAIYRLGARLIVVACYQNEGEHRTLLGRYRTYTNEPREAFKRARRRLPLGSKLRVTHMEGESTKPGVRFYWAKE